MLHKLYSYGIFDDRGLVIIKLLSMQFFFFFTHLYLNLAVNPCQEAIASILIRPMGLDLLEFLLFLLVVWGFLLPEATSTVLLALLLNRCFFHCEAHLIILDLQFHMTVNKIIQSI